MGEEKSRLGKGLEAIFGENVASVLDEIQHSGANNSEEIEVKLIHPNPYQPRQHFDQAKIDELAMSIQEHGVFTPVLIRKSVSGYQLIAGERRLRAVKQVGLERIPAIILDFDDRQMMEVSLIENIQREDLNVVEEAKAYQTLIERLGITQEELGKKVGKSRVHITNTLRLFQLPESVIQMLYNQELSMGQVKPLISCEDKSLVESIAKRIVKEKLSAREVEALMKKKPKSDKPVVSHHYDYAEQLLRNKLQTKVKIEGSKIQIHFDSESDLNRLLEIMDALED
jgi:ParB family transcriptional regulator, chromosome partitioning protein